MEWWIVAFLVGHLTALFSPTLLPTNLLLTVFFFILALTLILLRSAKLTFIVRAINGFVVGFVYLMLMANLHYSNNFVTNKKQDFVIKGKVSSVVVYEHDNPSQTFSLTIDTIDGMPINQAWYIPTAKIRVNWFKPSLLLQQGDELLATIKLSKAHGYQNRFGFDYNQWIFTKQFIGSGNIKKIHSYLSYSDAQSTSLFSNTQQNSTNKLITATTGLATQSIILAVGLGNRRLITSEDFELYNHMGISHLLAISGLHIGIIFLVVKVLIKLLLKTLRWHLSYTALQILVLSLLWCYITLIDFPISATRAALFVTFWVLLNLSFTNLNKVKLLLIVALFSLLLDPFAILSAAWWLTFSAVLGILLFIQKYPLAKSLRESDNEQDNRGFTSKLIYGLKRVIDKIRYLIKFQFFITVWMIPVVMFWFGGISLSGILTNLIAIPLFSLLLVPIIFIGTVFVLINNSEVSLVIATYIFDFVDIILNQLIGFFSHYPIFHSWLDVAYGLWFWLLLLIFIGLVFPMYLASFNHGIRSQGFSVQITDTKSNTCRLAGAALAVCFFVLTPILLSLPIWQDWQNKHVWKGKWLKPKLTMFVLDVGQGTSVLFQQGHKGFIYDLGPVYPSGFSATQAVVKPMLVGLGITDIDHIIISHNDSDHTGVLTVLGDAEWYNTKLMDCSLKSFLWLNNKVEILWPNHSEYEDIHALSKNDTSCVIKLTESNSNLSVLLTGDITSKVERRLVDLHNKNMINLKSDLLISAHHGSKYSSTTNFINAVSPTKVLHSAGVNNRFSFPTDEVIERYKTFFEKEQRQTTHVNGLIPYRQFQYSTNQVGMIEVAFLTNALSINKSLIDVKKGGIYVFGYLDHWQPFWKKQNPFSFTSEIR